MEYGTQCTILKSVTAYQKERVKKADTSQISFSQCSKGESSLVTGDLWPPENINDKGASTQWMLHNPEHDL